MVCQDDVKLGGHLWLAERPETYGRVIINPATGVLARYYHRYALFLAGQGFDVLTYDYRGIGDSRPRSLSGCGYRWRDWGEYDFDAAVRLMCERGRGGPLLVVGHSIGGFLPGLAASATEVDRMLTVGAQYAWWLDYAPNRRVALFLKWHLAMPLLTAVCGYFPGRRLGWLEDLPAGVANEWSFRRSRAELSYPRGRRQEILKRFEAVTAPILAVTAFDDEYATLRAVRRGLGYYRNAPTTAVELGPDELGENTVGHFSLFNSKHRTGFWLDTVLWLRDGMNPWPSHTLRKASSAAHEPLVHGFPDLSRGTI
ncbi:MAG TPA: alpha/beta fold hydrolase [Rhizobiaceae bacterium]|nr:alpha/beta fold hydrolase [Rhizobiaceae bacterium]